MPYPLTQLICSSAAYLGSQHLPPSTIKTYLAAIKFQHTSLGYGSLSSASLSIIQRGIEREYSLTASKHTRLPITPQILRGIKVLWSPQQLQHNTIMLWSAICTAFFGFFRLGEITAPSASHFDPKVHLTFNDISIDDPVSTKVITLQIKCSKTDQLRAGTNISLARSDDDLCPVAALLAYIAIRGDRPGPLFILDDGRFLTQPLLTFHLRQAISQLGLDPKAYAGHSLRIGAATTAAERGLEDSTIKALGRWKSDAYHDMCAGLSRILPERHPDWPKAGN